MSSIYDRDDRSKALEESARARISSNLDQVHHLLLLHKLANAYLTTLLSRFLDKSEEEASDESRAA